jgi:hypothetical protein
MQFFMGGGPGMGVPGMGGPMGGGPGMGGPQMMAPIDLKRSSVTIQKDPTIVPSIEWNADDIKF